ncbi:hypothetical protein [Aquipuribacter sp. MA13-6]|uniref:hypothetical protein n=1 Tax=unclassified Aquipuribacter TaxID=2635084 RepID=UPI003EE964CA
MVGPGDFPGLGAGGTPMISGEIRVISTGGPAPISADFPDLTTGGVPKVVPQSHAGDRVSVVGAFPDLETGGISKLFPDLRTGDVVKISGSLLDDLMEKRAVTIWKHRASEIAIAAAVEGEAPRLEDQVTATVTSMDVTGLHLHVRGQDDAGDTA